MPQVIILVGRIGVKKKMKIGIIFFNKKKITSICKATLLHNNSQGAERDIICTKIWSEIMEYKLPNFLLHT